MPIFCQDYNVYTTCNGDYSIVKAICLTAAGRHHTVSKSVCQYYLLKLFSASQSELYRLVQTNFDKDQISYITDTMSIWYK